LAQSPHEPPQSVPVSEPFFTPSLHVGAAHSIDALQYPLAQSALFAHDFPFAQSGHAPPQSTSLSMPFFAPSVHVGVAHCIAGLQYPFAHSPPARHG
jgi:hypothetical protein